jgi:tRNA (cytidine32/uridine32-2'-O)-methyltransferase
VFLRAAVDERELRVLHGILADAQRMASLALKSGLHVPTAERRETAPREHDARDQGPNEA